MRAGTAHAALLDSHARGEAGPDSDIDILIEFLPNSSPTVYSYGDMQLQVADLFPGKVDVMERRFLKDRLVKSVMSDTVYALQEGARSNRGHAGAYRLCRLVHTSYFGRRIHRG